MPASSLPPFDAGEATQQITTSMGAMVLLHASNQALIEAQIAPSSSSWYPVLDAELGAAENFVIGWRQSGFLYFQQNILGEIVACGQAFTGAQAAIDSLFSQLEQAFSADLLQQIVSALNALDAPVASMVGALDAYLAKLAAFQKNMEGPAANMNTSVAQIQAQEAEIAAQIQTINAQISALQQQVIIDRQAIAKAEASRSRGIEETIFGVLLAPFTGGLSLILAGIGVGTIAEAQEQVNQLQSTIAGYQSTIAGDQGQMTVDQQQVSTLNGLVMSMALIQSDMNDIALALGALRTTWTTLQGSIAGAAQDVAQAENAQQAVIAKLWFDIACDAWAEVTTFAESLKNDEPPTPTVVTIGN